MISSVEDLGVVRFAAGPTSSDVSRSMLRDGSSRMQPRRHLRESVRDAEPTFTKTCASHGPKRWLGQRTSLEMRLYPFGAWHQPLTPTTRWIHHARFEPVSGASSMETIAQLNVRRLIVSQSAGTASDDAEQHDGNHRRENPIEFSCRHIRFRVQAVGWSAMPTELSSD